MFCDRCYYESFFKVNEDKNGIPGKVKENQKLDVMKDEQVYQADKEVKLD